MTPGQLRKLAEEEDARGLELVKAGDRKRAAVAFRLAEHLRGTADELEAGLPGRQADATVNSERNKRMHSPEHKVALSASTATRDARFMGFIRKKGYTLNRLAKAVGMSPSGLSQARRKQSDPLFRRIDATKAKAIHALTGWPVDDWP